MREALVTFKHKTKDSSINGIYAMSLSDWNRIAILQEMNESIQIDNEYVSLDKFVLISRKEDEVESFKKLFGRTFGEYAPVDSVMELCEELSERDDY